MIRETQPTRSFLRSSGVGCIPRNGRLPDWGAYDEVPCSCILQSELRSKVFDLMTVSVKKQGLSVPATITRKAGIQPGDLVEFTARKGVITIHSTQSNE